MSYIVANRTPVLLYTSVFRLHMKCSTPGHHHVGVLLQAGLDAFMADVGVAVVDLIQNVVEVAVVVQVGEGPAPCDRAPARWPA